MHLGGPHYCQHGFPATYSFDDNSSPRINITLCGVPQPLVQGVFSDQNLTVLSRTVNRYTYIFTLQLLLLTQTACGKELTLTSTGYNGTLTKKCKIFVETCKYRNHNYSIPVLHDFYHVLNISLSQQFEILK